MNRYIKSYKEQILKGDIQKAYRGLMDFMMNLRNHFIKEYPADFISGHLYFGYMDITYFPFTPTKLKRDQLKIAIVLNHEQVRFEIWLVGQNKQIQKKYWELFKGSDWDKSRVAATAEYSILEEILVENPDFDDLSALTKKIETGAMKFIRDIMGVLY